MEPQTGPACFWNVPPPQVLEPGAPDLVSRIASLSGSPGVYAIRLSGTATHISWSANLSRRLTRLLTTSSRAQFGEKLRENRGSVHCWPTGSKLETSLLLYQLVKVHFPGDYLRRLHLRLPWFVGLTRNDPFPRLVISNRNTQTRESLIGPFPNRNAAQLYEEEVLSLFQIRRCTEVLHPYPEHPGCIYGEMNQCLRPCQLAVTQQEYATEVTRVSEFLATNGKSMIGSLAVARDRAAENMEFEHAAQMHKRLEKIQACSKLRDAAVTDIGHFNGVAVTDAIGEREFRLWPMLSGLWQEPVTLDFSAGDTAARSLDHQIRQQLEASFAAARTHGSRFEELAVFSRWYYSSWRNGSWYPFRTTADLDYRRLVRELSKMVRSREAKSPVANTC